MTVGNKLRFLVGQGSLPPRSDQTQNIQDPKGTIPARARKLRQELSQFLKQGCFNLHLKFQGLAK
jgi:hypothetical protein